MRTQAQLLSYKNVSKIKFPCKNLPLMAQSLNILIIRLINNGKLRLREIITNNNLILSPKKQTNRQKLGV